MQPVKKLLLVIFIGLSFFTSLGQSKPSGFPITKSTGWIEYGYLQNDSGRIDAYRDTNWTPRFIPTTVWWLNTGVDSAFWTYKKTTGQRWFKEGGGSGGGSTDTALIKTIVSDSNQLKANVNLNNLSISSIIETNIGHGVKDIANRNGKWIKGGVIYAYMDSYGTGTGASSVSKGWVQLFTSALGADLINYSVQGTSMEKRVPIDLINSPNMVDDTVNIPVKTYNDRLLIIARATNDVIINLPNYNSANYFSDGSLVVQAALNKGWDSSQILLVGPYWLGVNGFMQGGGVSGTPAATLSRQDSFLNAARQLSQTFHTLFFDIREAQRRFDTTHIMAADQLHPNDTGHAFIAAAILQYLNLQYSSATGGINTLIDVFFNHTTNITNTDTAWFATSGAGYGQTGLSDTYLSANTNGRLIMDFASGSSFLGFNSINAETGYAGMEAGIVIVGSNLYKIDGGTLSGILAAVASPNKYCILRQGSIFKVQVSTNNGNSWTDINTLTYTSSANMYIVTDISNIGILIEPQFYELIYDIPGALLFSDGFAFTQDGNNLFWDNTNKKLSIGTKIADSTFTLVGSIHVSAGARFSGLATGLAAKRVMADVNGTLYLSDSLIAAAANLGNSDLTQSSGLRQYTLGYFNASGDRYLSFGKADYTEKANILINANSSNHNGFISLFARDSTNGLQISETLSPNSNRKYTTLTQNSLTTTISNYMDSSTIVYTGATKLRYNFGKDTFSIKGNMPISASSSDSVLVKDNNGVFKLRAQSDIGGGLLSGTYTPTLTNVANVAASTAYSCQYSRVGTVVTVSGEVDIDPTTTLTLTQLGISLPIASNLTATNELGGTSADDLGTAARVAGDATNDRAEVRMTPTDVTNRRFSFTFTYRIL